MATRLDILREYLDVLQCFEHRVEVLTVSNQERVRSTQANILDSEAQAAPQKRRQPRKNGSFLP